MSELTRPTTSSDDVGAVRTLIGLGGVVALIVGVLILAWPGRTAAVVAGVIAAYALVSGVVWAAIAVFGAGRGAWWRAGHLLLGAAFVVAAILAFANLRATTAFLATFLGIMVGAVWVAQGAGTIALARYAPSRTWAIISGVFSVAAGVLMLFSPILGTVVLWWLLGIALVVLGVVQIVQAFVVGRALAA